MTMRQLMQLLGMILVPVLLVGCSSTKGIKKGLNADDFPLAYLHDRPAVQDKTSFTVGLWSVIDNAGDFTDSSEVVQVKNSVLPLLFYNSWKTEYECRLGRSGIEGDFCTFVNRSFRAESDRSGRYLVTPPNEPGEYRLTISVDQHATTSAYIEAGYIIYMLVAYYGSEVAAGGPGVSKVAMTAQLTKGDSLIFKKTFPGEGTGFPLQKQYKKVKELRKVLTNSMVESLSFACKDAIEQIVQEINTSLPVTQ